MKQDGIDLKTEATIAYGAPPLIAAKALDGEMDASLNFWNFCAQLEAKGFRRLTGIEDILPNLGAKEQFPRSAMSSMRAGPRATAMPWRASSG